MIIFQGVTKTYKGTQGEASAIRDISFKINPREFVSLVGKSGAGKSTIINKIANRE